MAAVSLIFPEKKAEDWVVRVRFNYCLWFVSFFLCFECVVSLMDFERCR